MIQAVDDGAPCRVLDSGIELIQKPFKPRVLLEKVREVLDAKAAMVRGAA